MKVILHYMKKHLMLIIIAVTVKLTGTIGDLMIPYILEYIIDDVVPAKIVSKVFFWGAIMIFAAFAVRFVNISANRIALSVARECIKKIRYDLFHKTINLSGSRFDAFGLPSLTSRMTSDSYNVQNFIQMFQTMGVRAPIMLIGGVIVTMTMDPSLAIILCFMIPLLAIVVFFVTHYGIPLYTKVQESLDGIVCIMREDITGIRVIKALSKTEYEKRRFGHRNEELMKHDIKAGVIIAVPAPFMQLCLNVGLTLVIIAGADRVNLGYTKPGIILAFLTYFNMILEGVMGLNRIFMLMTKATASAERIGEVLRESDDQKAVLTEQGKQQELNDFIVFDHVSFRYKQKEELQSLAGGTVFAGGEWEKCLDDITFTIGKGESLGIIGPTGCGKTTMINLLMRFYDVDGGRIFIDGQDVRTYDKDQLHRKFGVVFQNDIIFADTIANNISLGRPISQNEIRDAAAYAMAEEFIEQKDQKYDYHADIKGANLSGGQRQRILIARALAQKPEILIFDDSSSALDYKTDAAFRKSIQEHYSGTTTIMIAQRVSSIMNMTKIIVIEDGRIIGYGKHRELLETCQLYREIYDFQMGELA